MYAKLYNKELNGDRDELEITVKYDLGGMNYFSGGQRRRGIYVSLTPIHREVTKFGTMKSATLMGSKQASGYRIMLEELPRKSQKKIDVWTARIEPLTEQVALLFDGGDHESVFNTIKSVVLAHGQPVETVKQ